MKKLDFAGLASWCASSGYSLTDWRPVLPFSVESAKIPVPDDPQLLTELLDSVVGLASADCEMVVWIADWTIWNERSQEIGLRHVTLLVDSYVDHASEESHIYLLEASEWREVIALLTVPLLYGWDAYLFFRSGVALVEVSHDAYIEVSLAHGSPTSILGDWI
jgi:hypothetical protein